MSALTESIEAAQDPLTSPTLARADRRPSVPTTLLMRASSSAMRRFIAITSLKVSASLPSTPVKSVGSRCEKSPSRRAINPSSSWPEMVGSMVDVGMP